MLRQLKNQLQSHDLLTGYFGIECEVLRVNQDGTLALTPHPEAFGNKLINPYIKTDFSESQLEMITPPQENLETVHQFLTALVHLVTSELKEERLWPQSMPCILKDNQEIPIAVFEQDEQGLKEMEYRQKLLEKYGGKRQLISGIHYNFSLSDSLLLKMHQHLNPETNYQTFKDQIYLKIVRNYLRYHWFLIYFLGATPKVDSSYGNQDLAKEEFVSFRNTPQGYQNLKPLLMNYESIQTYTHLLQTYIDQGLISSPKEFYSPIRLKSVNPHDLLSSLQKDGINYLEVRGIDLNPLEKTGISLEDLKFIHLFMLVLLDQEETERENWQLEGQQNANLVAKEGKMENLHLMKSGHSIKMTDWSLEILNHMSELNQLFNLQLDGIIANKQKQLQNPSLTIAARVAQEIEKNGYKEANLQWASQHFDSAIQHPYTVPGFEDLELSTQLLVAEAIKKGVAIEILDRLENFIQLKRGNQIQLVKQATKTALDTYIAVLAMENKEVTKRLLQQKGIIVPKGALFDNVQLAKQAYDKFRNKAIVVKPKSTNFGLGITIFNPLNEKDAWDEALKFAFSHDQSVIIEEFQPGNEYRFLIVEDELIGVLQRIPANVIGDGCHTIQELVEIKNQNPLRGVDYQRPLEKIKIDDRVKYYLKMQGYELESILPIGVEVFLRENSNISTGGDSVDMTEAIPKRFKEEALMAVRQIGARICGVDMIIEDIQDENSTYSIIELNFNPAIHIHAYPYRGISRNAAPKILKALGFE